MIVMDYAKSIYIEFQLRCLLAQLILDLPSKTAMFVDELISAKEYGLALETMAAAVLEEGFGLPRVAFEKMEHLANMMHMNHEVIVPELKEQVVG